MTRTLATLPAPTRPVLWIGALACLATVGVDTPIVVTLHNAAPVGRLTRSVYAGLERLVGTRLRADSMAATELSGFGVSDDMSDTVVVAISQTAAMLNLPLYFHLVLGYGPLVATIALAPLFAALVLAGPVAGFLLERVAPRWLVGGGVIAIGLANFVLAAFATPSASYLGFVIPCLLVGTGFAIATTVRTAIIFASVPEGLPATAAALNESSMTVGSRLGIVLVSAVVAQVALAHYSTSVIGLPAADAATAIEAFRTVLVAVGTPSFTAVASAVSAADVRPYLDAYTAGVDAAFIVCGVVGVVGGAIALVAFGGEDPLKTVWEFKEERPSDTSVPV